MVLQLQQENALLMEQVRLKDEQLAYKDELILYLQRQLYGRRSEKKIPDYSGAQLSLFDAQHGSPELEQEAAVASSIVEDIKQKAEVRRKAASKRAVSEKRAYKIPAHIERRETIVNPATFNPNTMIKIGEDVSEQLMLEQSKFWVKRIVRPVYKVVKEQKQEQEQNQEQEPKQEGNDKDEHKEQESLSTRIVQAPLTQVILPGCMAGNSLLSQIIIDKFLYHLPEYRQSIRFKRLGVEITTSSINRWVHAVADKLYPLYVAQMEKILSSNYIQVDETSHSVIDRPGSARKAYIWVVRSVLTPGVFFHYDKGSRSQEVLLKMLKNFQGALQSDGYAAYSIYEDKQGVLPLGCMAHVRRKFENALVTTPEAQKALDYIAVLYMLEANLKADGADFEQIRKEREEKAYPILQQMERWMRQTYNTCTPKSSLGKAISYAFGMWPRVSRYCKEGYYHIDNNAVENTIRPITLGRKNYLFSGNDSGAEDNCIFYTLIGTCLQAGVEPTQWFTDTLEKIPNLQTPIDWNALLP